MTTTQAGRNLSSTAKMFTDEAWEAGWAKAQSLGLAQVWQPASRPMTKQDVEQIVAAVANHGFEEMYAEQLLADAHWDYMASDAIDRLRDHLRDYVAVEVARAGCVMMTLPRIVIDHPERGMTRVRVIVPVRRLQSDSGEAHPAG